MTGGELPRWVELDDGVLVGIEPVGSGSANAMPSRRAPSGDQIRRSGLNGGPGTGRAFEPSASATRKNALLLDASRIPHICEARAVRRPGHAVLLLGAVRDVAEVPPVGVDDVHVAQVAHTQRQEREPPTVRRPCGLRPPMSGSTSSERHRPVPVSPDVRRDLVGVRSIDIDDPQRVRALRRNRPSGGRRSDGRPATRPDRSRTRPARRAAPRQGRRSRR